MADERDEQVATESKEEANLPEKKGGLLKKILIATSILCFQCIAAYLLLSLLVIPKLKSSQGESQIKNDKVSEFIEEEEKPKIVEEEPEAEDAGVFMMDDIVINPSGSDGRRFLVVSFAFMTKEKEGPKEIETKGPAIKDGIISLLSRKTVSWLININNREVLRREVKFIVNRRLLNTKVTKIYFTKFVLQ